MDSAGRLFVADRANNRIQIFDQDGKFLAEWKQFGRPSGIYIRNDILYVADSQSNDKVNAPFRQGIRIGSVKDGKVTAFIAAPDPKTEMPEGVAADKNGNVFGGFTAKHGRQEVRQELTAAGRVRAMRERRSALQPSGPRRYVYAPFRAGP